MSAIALAGLYAAINVFLRLPGIPYNAAELFPRSLRHVRIAAFCLVLVWSGFAPAWIAHLVARRPRQWLLLPVWTVGTSLVGWVLLEVAVTLESLWDILGSPVHKWPGDWELIYRFLALNGQFVLTTVIAGTMVSAIGLLGWAKGVKRGATALFWSLPWLILAWMVVIKWASTDNLTELIRSTPSLICGPVALASLVALLAANAAALGLAFTGRSLPRKIIAIVVTILLIGPGWYLLQLGLEPTVLKYGRTFSPLSFLLGPDRQANLSAFELLLRWSVVQLAVVAALTWGHIVAISLRPAHHIEPLPGGHHDTNAR